MPNESRYNKIFDNAIVNFDETTEKFLKSVADSFGAIESPPLPPEKKQKPRPIIPLDVHRGVR